MKKRTNNTVAVNAAILLAVAPGVAGVLLVAHVTKVAHNMLVHVRLGLVAIVVGDDIRERRLIHVRHGGARV